MLEEMIVISFTILKNLRQFSVISLKNNFEPTMRLLLFILMNFICAIPADAGNPVDKIKLGSNAKTDNIEIRFNSTYKNNLTANVVVLNAEGKEVSVFKCDIKKGMNAVCLENALNLDEGIYTVNMTVKRKTSSTKFVVFK